MPRLTSAEQTNSSIVYGDRLMLKIFRVIEEGPSLEYEVGNLLVRVREPQCAVLRVPPDVREILDRRQVAREHLPGGGRDPRRARCCEKVVNVMIFQESARKPQEFKWHS